MPVELPTPEETSSPPQPPRTATWLLICLAITVASMGATLLTWPKHQPTNTEEFWLRLLGIPAVVCGFAYGLRRYWYEQQLVRRQKDAEVLAQDTREAIEFAQEPLSVLASAYACAFDGDAAKNIAARERLLEARRPPRGKVAIRHTALRQFNQASLADRYRHCFAYLLDQLDEVLRTLPPRIPLEVYLQLPNEACVADIRLAWQECWEATGLRAVDAVALPLEEGVAALDAWLDRHGGPELEKIALYVAAQLHETPPVNSAEAAAALLLGWAPLLERRALTSQALIHRPVEEAGGDVNGTIARAIQWSKTETAKIKHLWQAGMASADRADLMRALSDPSLGFSSGEAHDDKIHDVDAAIGHAGVAAPWLAMALAVHHASQTQAPQLVVSRQHTLCAAVVQPAAINQELGQQG